jgi:hypothetical protein
MACPHGNPYQSCYDCDFAEIQARKVSVFQAVGEPVREAFDKMVMSLTPKPKKRSGKAYALGQKVEYQKAECKHESFNYTTNGEGGMNVWCRDCGEALPESRADTPRLEIYKENDKTVIEAVEVHELDVIQRLSEAYRENEREIEAEETDEEKKKELGTVYTGK